MLFDGSRQELQIFLEHIIYKFKIYNFLSDGPNSRLNLQRKRNFILINAYIYNNSDKSEENELPLNGLFICSYFRTNAFIYIDLNHEGFTCDCDKTMNLF